MFECPASVFKRCPFWGLLTGLGVRGGTGEGPCPGESRGYNALVDRVVHVPYTVEQDETGWWCAHAPLPGGGANGEGQTREEAVADLRQALDGWFAEFGVPEELTVTVPDVA